MHFKWNYEPPTPEQKQAAAELGTKLGISPILAGILIRRNITTESAAKRFFRPQLNDLINPFLMKDMDLAVDRLNDAMGRKERIMVYGDYDVDGCTAVALVFRCLSQYYSNLEYYIPNRNDEGYGVSKQGIDYAIEQGVKLIVVLDCGIKAVEEIQYAKDHGIDFIICDHHVPDDVLPPAVAVLNAKRVDDEYPYKELSGCGVGFKLMQAFAVSNGIPFCTLIPLLDLVAVSIASDIVPIDGENRILAFHGLRQLNNNPSTGLKAVIEVCGLKDKDVTMSDIIFKIGPRINASGRMQRGEDSVDLLVEHDYESAFQMAQIVNFYNDERKELDKKMTEEANSIAENMEADEDKSSIVIYNKDWHKGVIGIVASRLTEVFYKPSVVLTLDDGCVTGSARSVSGFDVYSAVQSCEDLLDNFGGHTYAAGLSMKLEHVEAFKQRFEAYVSEHINKEQIVPTIEVDAQVTFKEVSMRLYNDLKKMRPFGPMNPKPLFMTTNVYDYGTSKVVGRSQSHIKLELVDNKSNNVMNGIAFGQSSQARYIKTKRSFDIVYSIEENTHRRGEVQLQIEDIKPNEK